jgi:hypothetical protein
MSSLIKLTSLVLFVYSFGIRFTSQETQQLLELGKPTVKISISPAAPTTEDVITFTVEAQDNSGTGIKRMVILVNEIEVKVCLISPCVFFGGPYPEGRLKYGTKVYDYTTNEPATSFRTVDVIKASRSKGSLERRIDLIPLAENEETSWANGYTDLRFPGEENDIRGYVCYRNNAQLEDGMVYSKVLLTHPQFRDQFGMIAGIFKLKNLPDNATFRAKIGFLSEPERTDSAEFRVFVNADPSFYAAKQCSYDTNLDDLGLDLGRYAGQDVELVLEVHVLFGSGPALAAWVNPRIEW